MLQAQEHDINYRFDIARFAIDIYLWEFATLEQKQIIQKLTTKLNPPYCQGIENKKMMHPTATCMDSEDHMESKKQLGGTKHVKKCRKESKAPRYPTGSLATKATPRSGWHRIRSQEYQKQEAICPRVSDKELLASGKWQVV